MNPNKNMRIFGGGVLAFAAVAAIAIAVNVLVSGTRARWDLTQDRIFTLSQGTRTVLKDLPGPVTLKFFYSESDAEVPVILKNYARRVEDLLREYQGVSKGKVRIEKYDPKPDSDAEDWARRYGINGAAFGFMGPQLYLGLVAVVGDREAVLPVLDPQTENLLEYNVTRLIASVAYPKKPVVGLLSSLPVMGGMDAMSMMGPRQRPRPAWLAFSDLKEMFEVRQLDTAIEDIPAEVDALVLVHPKNLSDKTLYAIDQFVLRGGRLVAFMDPMCMVEQESSPMPQMGMMGGQGPSDLGRLLPAWGVTFDGGRVACDLGATTRLRGPQDTVEESPVWLSLRRANIDRQDALTAQIENLMMPFAGTFSVSATNGLQVTPLVKTSESSGLVDGMTAQFGSEGVRRGFVKGGQPLNLAVRLQGKFKTAFPDGLPKDPADTNATAAAAAPAGLKESKEPVSVILVGDVDMLHDRFSVTEVNFLGMRGYEPINDNISLFLNAIEQAAGNASLASIRARARTVRPFDKVNDLLRQAQEQYQQEEAALQGKLEMAQQRLSELQDKKDTSQQLILSPEQKAEIEKFRTEEYETRKQLKLVRRALREDIERLGAWVKGLNILLMPALVILAGVGIGAYRRNRR